MKWKTKENFKEPGKSLVTARNNNGSRSWLKASRRPGKQGKTRQRRKHVQEQHDKINILKGNEARRLRSAMIPHTDQRRY